MKKLACVALGLAVVSVGQAQDPVQVLPQGEVISRVLGGARDAPNPVPTRIETAYYGENLNTPILYVDCYIGGESTSAIRVTGGEPGETVALFCATEPAEVILPWGVFLVSPACEVIPGVFDDEGCFYAPINLGDRGLIGQTLYFQAGVLRDDIAMLSWGFKLRFANGNPQPALNYEGPAAQAIPCKGLNKFLPTMYTLLLRFEAPASYELFVNDVVYIDWTAGKIMVYATLKSPGPPTGENQWHRAVAPLGPYPTLDVEVWVNLDHGDPCAGPYQLAAVVDLDY